jgi:hypothetical protein
MVTGVLEHKFVVPGVAAVLTNGWLCPAVDRGTIYSASRFGSVAEEVRCHC